MTPDVHVLK